MKYLKKFWAWLGENNLPIMPMTLAITILTVIQLFILDIPPALQALMILINGLMVLIALEE